MDNTNERHEHAVRMAEPLAAGSDLDAMRSVLKTYTRRPTQAPGRP